jgi:hypothetical protein
VTAPKKPRKLPPRGKGGKFVKSIKPVEVKVDVPELVETPTYSPHRVGIGEPIDWQRELTREVLPPRRPMRPQRESNKLGWGVIGAAAVGVGYALSRLPSKGRRS